MKKSFLVGALFVLLVLAGCTSSTYPEDDAYHAQWDYPYMYVGQGLETARTEKGYYFLLNNLIYFMKHGDTKPQLIDSRVDNKCADSPNRSNCLAYVQRTHRTYKRGNTFIDPPRFLQYYDSKLYVLENDRNPEKENERSYLTWKLTSMDVDGSNRKVVKTFEAPPDWLALHRGYLYYSIWEDNKDGSEQAKVLKAKLTALDKSPEVLYSETDNIMSVMTITPYGNQLYWTILAKDNYKTQRYDSLNGEIKTLFDRKDGSYNFLLSISENRLYFSYLYREMEDKRSHKLYSSDLHGKNIIEEKIEYPPVFSHMYKDKNYAYIHPSAGYVRSSKLDIPVTMKIFKQNKKVHEVDMSSLPPDPDLVAGDERYMFMRINKGTNSSLLYLDKSQIESGQAVFKPLLGVEPVN
ncbi:DUF5050 domain-containing protein [Paenibacillus sp. SC116]|uniref:DUF5050 domain-containing protein n=1 Tax=Paenibacillus sp. SC116 TaxID=2968986 RepID=UPI00215AEB3B|nr:DUF5050 domain-containing protein [Paenibacillus sp. SC116]MCR8845622.1 DUF5050 domain-containing protein [Paenibacillus sp. SC116]